MRFCRHNDIHGCSVSNSALILYWFCMCLINKKVNEMVKTIKMMFRKCCNDDEDANFYP